MRLGLGSDAAKLNQSLLNLRKRGALRGLASRRTILKDQSDYRFAAEIAARFLERENEITLDQIICDPRYAERFDEIARTIVPGGKPFEYRWAALNLRKQKRLKPELLARVAPPSKVLQFKVAWFVARRGAAEPGIVSLLLESARRSTSVSAKIFRIESASTSIILITKNWRAGSGNSATARFISSFKSWTSRSRSASEGLSRWNSFGLACRSST